MPRDEVELEPGEELLVVAYASFRGAAASTVRSTFALGSARMRMKAFHAWHDAALASGFPPVPPEMVVAVSDRRLLFGKPTFWGRPPARYWSAFDLGAVAQVVALRHGLVTGVAFAFTDGVIVEIEAVRGRRLRRLVRVIEDRLSRR
ncbi:MAG TPA: hypothetical protein VGP92_14705 [Acidimicrobiia bacterium]|nr:hypothetical protein [Acidimicrobiia bacterium]